MSSEKTEKATPKRKQDERKKGNVFQSQDVTIVFSLLATFFGFKMLAPSILNSIELSPTEFLGLAGSMKEVTMADARTFFLKGCITFLMTAFPMLLICGLVAIISTVAQTRGLFTMESLSPKFSRLSPLQGIKKMFSLRGVIELLKAMVKITILGSILWSGFQKEIGSFYRLIDMEPMQAMAYTGNVILSMVKSVAIAMAFVAGFDLFYQWWDYEKNLRMSHQELKEEYKQTEGDPQIKGKIRERQQAQARQRMMQKVPSADVVIRNPTHYAVAIQYDASRSNAPVVVAKGADSLALRIVAVAEEHGVFVTENRPLARGLYEAVELDQEIPDRFYQPVAEVLAFVYSLKKKELK